jgi:hypothetical protein
MTVEGEECNVGYVVWEDPRLSLRLSIRNEFTDELKNYAKQIIRALWHCTPA